MNVLLNDMKMILASSKVEIMRDGRLRVGFFILLHRRFDVHAVDLHDVDRLTDRIYIDEFDDEDILMYFKALAIVEDIATKMERLNHYVDNREFLWLMRKWAKGWNNKVIRIVIRDVGSVQFKFARENFTLNDDPSPDIVFTLENDVAVYLMKQKIKNYDWRDMKVKGGDDKDATNFYFFINKFCIIMDNV